MRRKISFSYLKIVVLFAVLVVAVFFLCKGVQKMETGQQAESLKQLDSSIRKATMTCYATEGVYPPTIQYLKENYGIQIDESKFTVFYEVYGDKMMPQITVIERQ